LKHQWKADTDATRGGFELPINSIIVTHYLKNAICMKNPEII